MPKSPSIASQRIRAEVIRLVALIPVGKFTTYGSIAHHMNIGPRQVAFVMARLTPEESRQLPWHRVVGADARLSPNIDAELRQRQWQRLEAEGMSINDRGFIQNDEAHFHIVGVRRDISWGEAGGR